MGRDELRRRRDELSLTQEAVANRMGVGFSTYRSWENEDVTPRQGHRRRLADVLEVPLATVNRWLGLNGDVGYEGPPGEWLSLYANLEQAASELWAFEPWTIHGLLQTRDYAAAVERAGLVMSEDDIARFVEGRMSRQQVLQREPDPLELSVVLDESALRRLTGSPGVMAAQLDHLAEVSEHPNVDLRVLPLEAGTHAASSPLTVLTSRGQRMVCLSDRTGMRYLEARDVVDTHVAVLEHLTTLALPPSASVDRIRTAAKELRP